MIEVMLLWQINFSQWKLVFILPYNFEILDFYFTRNYLPSDYSAQMQEFQVWSLW